MDKAAYEMMDYSPQAAFTPPPVEYAGQVASAVRGILDQRGAARDGGHVHRLANCSLQGAIMEAVYRRNPQLNDTQRAALSDAAVKIARLLNTAIQGGALDADSLLDLGGYCTLLSEARNFVV